MLGGVFMQYCHLLAHHLALGGRNYVMRASNFYSTRFSPSSSLSGCFVLRSPLWLWYVDYGLDGDTLCVSSMIEKWCFSPGHNL